MKPFIFYPRLTTIALSYIAAVLVFFFLGENFFHNLIVPLGIIGIFIAGSLYTYSFTASTGALLLIALAPHYPAGMIAVVGGIGATLADFTLFRFIGNSLHKEITRLSKSKLVCEIGATSLFCKAWFRNALGALILASPFPDELAIALMSAAKIRKETFIWLTFIADTVGIYLLVSAAKVFAS
ncbi:MAG TPA: hypothetical protein VI957_02630 [Candidatus Paceibacterota bacterium]